MAKKRDILEYQIMAQELEELRMKLASSLKEFREEKREYALFLLEIYNDIHRAYRTESLPEDISEGMRLLMEKIVTFLQKNGFIVFPKEGDDYDERSMEVVERRGTGRKIMEIVSYGLKYPEQSQTLTPPDFRIKKLPQEEKADVLKHARVVVG